MNVNLGETFDKFVADLLATGEYQSQSEIIREGLRLLKDKETLRQIKLDELRKALQPAIEEMERGEGIVLSTREERRAFFDDISRRGHERLAQKKKKEKKDDRLQITSGGDTRS